MADFSDMLSKFKSDAESAPPPAKRRRKKKELQPSANSAPTTSTSAPVAGPSPTSLPPPSVTHHSVVSNLPPVLPKVKIYGERNTGTRFLHQLLIQNCYVDMCDDSAETAWKHGYPDKNHIPKKDRQDAVFIIVVRDPHDWLHSTFNRPYHMVKHDTFDSFVTSPVMPLLNDPAYTPRTHPIFTDARETNRTPLQLYSSKYEAYVNFFHDRRAVLVNLKYIQENPSEFLSALCEAFPVVKLQSSFFSPVEQHTKTKKSFEIENDTSKQRHPDLLNYTKLESDVASLTVKFNHGPPPTYNFDACHKKGSFPPLPGLEPSDVILLCKAKNESALLPSYVAHYSKLGVDAMIMLDNSSTDGTPALARELCRSHSIKLFLFTSSKPLLEFEGIWFQALSSNYCVKHWTVVADVDELLMYHSCESVDLKALSKVMSARDQKVLNTFLLDVYPKGPLSSSSSDASKHEYFDYDESVPSSQRNPPNFALKDGFYDCHKELTEHCKKTMVRVRIGMADRNFVYSEKASFFKFSKKMSIFPGHHRVSVDSRMLSNSADSNYKQTSDVDPLFYDYRNKVQGVVIHRLFVTIDHRTRYLPDSEYKERVRKVIDDGRVDLHRQGVSRRVGDSTGLPYLGGAERQAFIAQASGKKD